MDNFSISELQQFSGIKAHTIRMWEQRYGALKPNRSEGNTRYYKGDQLRRLLNIVSLLNTNYKVSELCAMSDGKLRGLLEEQLSKSIAADSAYDYFISQLIAAAMEFDEVSFNKFYSNCILRFGIKNTYVEVVNPTLIRLGLLWAKDALPPAQEHFISNLFRQKFLAATEELPISESSSETWMLFLPEDEFHEAGLLFANFLLRKAGKKVIYLGANVPYDSLTTAIKEIKPTHLLFFLVRKYDSTDDQALLSDLVKASAGSKVFVACEPNRLEVKPKKIKTLHSVQDLEDEIHTHLL